MIPLVGFATELERMRALVAEVLEEEGATEIPIGTMIELPRAAVCADQIAPHADFFSFGTNDLTQTVLGVSRDDAEGKFLAAYVEDRILESNPFATIDVDGVGALVRMGCERGRGAHRGARPRRLRRARRRPRVDRVLPHGRPRLRVVLAVPRARGPAGGGAGGARRRFPRPLMGILALGGGALRPAGLRLGRRAAAGRAVRRSCCCRRRRPTLPEIVVRFYELFVPTRLSTRRTCRSTACRPTTPASGSRAPTRCSSRGGNTANALAIWRLHGIDARCGRRGSAARCCGARPPGMICWFEAGVTDSFRAALDGMRDGLGFLPGSACPHYDGEERRRPVYMRLVRDEGFPPGVAADDGCGPLVRGHRAAQVLRVPAGRRAYRVSRRARRRSCV